MKKGAKITKKSGLSVGAKTGISASVLVIIGIAAYLIMRKK
jgi:hypothetical protein